MTGKTQNEMIHMVAMQYVWYIFRRIRSKADGATNTGVLREQTSDFSECDNKQSDSSNEAATDVYTLLWDERSERIKKVTKNGTGDLRMQRAMTSSLRLAKEETSVTSSAEIRNLKASAF